MMIRSALLAAALFVGAPACSRVSTSYTPNKAEYRNGVQPTTKLAVVAYEGDIETLVAAGGKVIGSMNGAGNGFSSQRNVERKVQRNAAELGATHIVFVSAYAEEDRTPVSYHTSCQGQRCTTTTAGGYRFYRPRAGYVLIRVARKNWSRLPAALGGPDTAAPPPRTRPKRSSFAAMLGLRENSDAPAAHKAPARTRDPAKERKVSPEVRERCYAAARAEVSDDPQEAALAPPGPVAEAGSAEPPASRAASFGSSYGALKAQDETRNEASTSQTQGPLTHDEKLRRAYWVCVKRETQQETGQERSSSKGGE